MMAQREVRVGVTRPDAIVAADHKLLDQLQALELDQSTSLHAYRGLAQQITDPTASVVLGLIARDTEQHRAFLQRMLGGALDALNRPDSGAEPASPGAVDDRFVVEFDALARTARSRVQRLRDLACTERGLDHAPLAMLLDAIAADSDKHARLLRELGRHLARVDRRGSRLGPPITPGSAEKLHILSLRP